MGKRQPWWDSIWLKMVAHCIKAMVILEDSKQEMGSSPGPSGYSVEKSLASGKSGRKVTSLETTTLCC